MVNYLAFGCWNKFRNDADERQENYISTNL